MTQTSKNYHDVDMTDAVELLAEELWKFKFGPIESNWAAVKRESPVNTAYVISQARDIIRRARLVPQDDRLDLRLKRDLVSR